MHVCIMQNDAAMQICPDVVDTMIQGQKLGIRKQTAQNHNPLKTVGPVPIIMQSVVLLNIDLKVNFGVFLLIKTRKALQ
jgi:hypothetical protein